MIQELWKFFFLIQHCKEGFIKPSVGRKKSVVSLVNLQKIPPHPGHHSWNKGCSCRVYCYHFGHCIACSPDSLACSPDSLAVGQMSYWNDQMVFAAIKWSDRSTWIDPEPISMSASISSTIDLLNLLPISSLKLVRSHFSAVRKSVTSPDNLTLVRKRDSLPDSRKMGPKRKSWGSDIQSFEAFTMNLGFWVHFNIEY